MNPPAASRKYRPSWAQKMFTVHRSAIANQFVLHFNINDSVVDMSELSLTPENSEQWSRNGRVVDIPKLFRVYLHDMLYDEVSKNGFGCQSVYTYSLAGGLLAESNPTLGDVNNQKAWDRANQANKDLMTALFNRHKTQQGQPQEGREVEFSDQLIDNLRLLGHMLRIKHPHPQNSREEMPIAVILDFSEKLFPPHIGEGHGTEEQLQALETVQSWAIDNKIRETTNIIILLTTNIGNIPSMIYTGGSGCQEIRVFLPNTEERKAFIDYKIHYERYFVKNFDAKDFAGANGLTGQIDMLANMTQGLRLNDIDNMARKIIMDAVITDNNALQVFGQQITTEPIFRAKDIQLAKEEAIEAQSSSLLEIVRSPRGFPDIGGMEKLKKYLSERTDLMKKGTRNPIIPNGLLLAGPPGTGKTIIAEALARESGFNIVKMRNIRDKWVGSSERNLDMVLKLLEDLRPVVVFIDEIDQAMGQRETGQSGDSGVGARMFGRILEAMSDPTHRGQILWVAATNRADLLDDAMLRRFDRVIPLLPPDESECELIYISMLKMIRRHSGEQMQVEYSDELKTVSGFADVARVSVEHGLTGAGVETVVRRAIEIGIENELKAGHSVDDRNLPKVTAANLIAAIQDYKPNQNRVMYDFQSLISLRACNFKSVIPELPLKEPYSAIMNSQGEIDSQKLDQKINDYAKLLNNR